MGRKLDIFLDRLSVKLRMKAQDHLGELDRGLDQGRFPRPPKDGPPLTSLERHQAFLGLDNTLRIYLGQPQIEERVFVEIEPNETWESILADFERTQQSRGPGWPVEVGQAVRGLKPAVRPGIWEIKSWANIGRDDDIPLERVAQFFAEAEGFEGWFAPFVKWITLIGVNPQRMGPVYRATPAPDGGDVPNRKKLGPNEVFELVFTDFRAATLDLVRADPNMHGGVPCASSSGLYVGAKFIE